LLNSNIPEYREANRFNHDPKRPRKLLLHAAEIAKLSVGVLREGLTIIPLKIFFNQRGRAKIDIALAKGKKLHDKREAIKDRDWGREKSRLLRDKG
jgi:SsrA-binding protein